MATEIDWTSIGDEVASGGKSTFVRFANGTELNFRPIGGGWEFCKFFIPDGEVKTIVVNKQDAAEASQILSEHAGRPIEPSRRFAINVLDRADGHVKILEGGKSILEEFATWTKANNCKLGTQSGGDWVIKAKGDGMARKYKTSYVRPTQISAEEKDQIKENKEMADLEEIFKGTPVSDVLTKAYGAANEPQSAPQSGTDSFGDDDKLW